MPFDIKEGLTHKLGPLPVWGWGAIAIGAYVGYEYVYKPYFGGGSSSSTTSATDTTGTLGGPPPVFYPGNLDFGSGGGGGGDGTGGTTPPPPVTKHCETLDPCDPKYCGTVKATCKDPGSKCGAHLILCNGKCLPRGAKCKRPGSVGGGPNGTACRTKRDCGPGEMCLNGKCVKRSSTPTHKHTHQHAHDHGDGRPHNHDHGHNHGHANHGGGPNGGPGSSDTYPPNTPGSSNQDHAHKQTHDGQQHHQPKSSEGSQANATTGNRHTRRR